MDTARVPVMLARDYGAGSVIVAQLGIWSISPKRQMNPDHLQEAPVHLQKLSENLVDWAGGKHDASLGPWRTQPEGR